MDNGEGLNTALIGLFIDGFYFCLLLNNLTKLKNMPEIKIKAQNPHIAKPLLGEYHELLILNFKL